METKKNMLGITLTPEEQERSKRIYNMLVRTPRKKSKKKRIADDMFSEQVAKRITEKLMQIVNRSLEGLPNQ